MKTCFKCNQEKDRSEFYAHPQMADGLLGKCKECTKKDIRNHRQKNPRPREYDKERFRNNPDRRAKVYAGVLRRKALSPDKYKAHTTLCNAVRRGQVLKPSYCTVCGDTSRRIEGHHPDYSRPLEVVWCCTPCHRTIDGTRIIT